MKSSHGEAFDLRQRSVAIWTRPEAKLYLTVGIPGEYFLSAVYQEATVAKIFGINGIYIMSCEPKFDRM